MSKRDEIFDAFRKGCSNQQVADQFNINIRTVYQYRSAYKNMILSLTSRVAEQRAEGGTTSELHDILSEYPDAYKLKASIKDEIFDDFSKGYTIQQIATKYNLSHSTIKYYYYSYKAMKKALVENGDNSSVASQIDEISDDHEDMASKSEPVTISYRDTSITRDGDVYYFVCGGARFSSTEEEFVRLVHFFNAMKEMK